MAPQPCSQCADHWCQASCLAALWYCLIPTQATDDGLPLFGECLSRLHSQVFYYTHIIGFVVWTLFALMHYKVSTECRSMLVRLCAEGRHPPHIVVVRLTHACRMSCQHHRSHAAHPHALRQRMHSTNLTSTPLCPCPAQALANWIVPGMVLYLLDRSFRAWQTATNIVRLAPSHVTVRGGTITLTLGWPEVKGREQERGCHDTTHALRASITTLTTPTPPQGSRVAAGQTVYIRCTRVSYLQVRGPAPSHAQQTCKGHKPHDPPHTEPTLSR